ncbi:vacuolar calcium ion transporter [Aspergillus ibericus CBS 121593]|uniref:Vacuolar calcium ion transporter n=1 Tax=Aspergillus ibericus CBS 121593 TaxID=1448316 RepID=A0A395GXF9_9EURO|nr:vacuolar calcium ion transporter [Aspergillus ibericus CBS 121593]RAL00040.1 vacuolar calcium ion transporter [Aspergillus ibericus CBS 121593]
MEDSSGTTGASDPPTPPPSDRGSSPTGSLHWRPNPFHVVIVRIGSHPFLRASIGLVLIGFISGILGWPRQVVFWLNLGALVPLMALITIAIAELSHTLGPFLHELLKSTLGNSVELVVGVVSAQMGQGRIFHSVVVGSILCYSLLVLGSCFLISGYDKEHLIFDRTLTSIMSSLMIMVCIALVLPGIMVTFPSLDTISINAIVTSHEVRLVSYGIAIILLLLLAVFLLFQLKTHAAIFHVAERTGRAQIEDSSTEGRADELHPDHHLGVFTPSRAGLALLIGVTCLAICVTHLVNSVNVSLEKGTATSFPILVWVPLVGNVTKYITIVVISRQGHVETAIRTILNSILRLTLLVTPALVLMGWALGQPVTLQMDNFEATMLFLAAMVMSHVIHEGRANYFDGLMLCGTYIITGVAFYVCPSVSTIKDVAVVNT